MSVVLTIVLYALLASAFVIFVYALFSAVLTTDHGGERTFRVLLMLVGATVVLASKSAGVSYADFIVHSLGSIRPATFGLVAVVAPGAAGAALAWYLVRQARNSEDFAARTLALVGMLAATQFIVLFGVSLSAKGFDANKAIIPNAAFVVGFTLFAMRRWDRSVLSGFGGGVPTETGTRGAFGAKRAR